MFKLLGTTDTVNTCDRCGKSGLKKTVALQSDKYDTVYYGVDCAADSLRGNKRASTKDALWHHALVIRQAQTWINNRLPLDKIARGITDKYSFPAEAYNNMLLIHLDNPIRVSKYLNGRLITIVENAKPMKMYNIPFTGAIICGDHEVCRFCNHSKDPNLAVIGYLDPNNIYITAAEFRAKQIEQEHATGHVDIVYENMSKTVYIRKEVTT